MRCPTCKALGLEPPTGMFCGKVCFAANWESHKAFHSTVSRMQAAAAAAERGAGTRGAGRGFAGYTFSGPLRPGTVSPQRRVPEGLPLPDYAVTGSPRSEDAVRSSNAVHVHSSAEIEASRRAGALGREVLDVAAAALKPGVSGEDIDRIVFEACEARGVYPSPLNYRGFPKSVCVCVRARGSGGRWRESSCSRRGGACGRARRAEVLRRSPAVAAARPPPSPFATARAAP